MQKENFILILKNGVETGLENLEAMTSNPWKMMEQINVETAFRHEGKKGDFGLVNMALPGS